MKIKLTDQKNYPVWLQNTLTELEPLENAIINGKSFTEMAAGTLSLDRFQLMLVNFLPIVANFPRFMTAILEKIPTEETKKNKLARHWLTENIELEQYHLGWYRDWAIGFGVSKEKIYEPEPPVREVSEMLDFLQNICTKGTVAESLAGLNYSFEGPTGIWSRKVYRNIKNYKKQGVVLNRKSKAWLAFHGKYDEFHPREALELIKDFTQSKREQEKVKSAAKKGMKFYAKIADISYQMA